MILAVGLLGFTSGMVAVWLGAKGIFRLARVGPSPTPGTPGAEVEWLAYGDLLAGALAAALAPWCASDWSHDSLVSRPLAERKNEIRSRGSSSGTRTVPGFEA